MQILLTSLLSIGVIFILLLTGIGINQAYRRFAARHPELGPYRKEEGCNCGAGQCDKKSGCN